MSFTKTIKILFKHLPILLLVGLATSTIYGVGEVDLTFKAFPSKQFSGNFQGSFVVQNDGKLLIYGNPRVVNGVATGGLVRLNTDGTTDSSFNCQECQKLTVSSVFLQADGKILVAGFDLNAFSTLYGLTDSKLYRLNSDGSVDNSFSNPFPNEVFYGITDIFSVQSDGKIFIGRRYAFQGFSSLIVYRLNPNGNIDNGFNNFTTNTRLGRGWVSGIYQLPDGKLYLYGATLYGAFARLNSDGTEDTTFEKPAFTSNINFVPPFVNDIVIQSDGKILLAGGFNTVNGTNYESFARLNDNGSVDLNFAKLTDYITAPLEEFSDGKILASKRISISTDYLPVKLNANGTMDTALNLPANLETVYNFKVTNTSRIYISGRFFENGKTIDKYARLNSDGSLDSSFNLDVRGNGIINNSVLQSNGKVVMVGDFDRVNNVINPKIARVNPDGGFDRSFSSGTGFDQQPQKVVISGDGKIIVIGDFNSYNGTTHPKIARLESDGSLDVSFNPALDNGVNTAFRAIALQTDGKILVGGSFSTVNGQDRKGIVRLNQDGSLDTSFDAGFGSSASISDIFVQSDGKIMVAGGFNGVSGFNRQNLVRLNADGSLDNTFNAGSIGGVGKIIRTSNGNYFAKTGTLLKLNSDGTSFSGFNPPEIDCNCSSSSLFNDFVVLDDESIIVVGAFTLVNNKNKKRIARLFPNGEIDILAFTNGANGEIKTVSKQNDGKLIVGGDFSLIENVPRSGVARLAVPELRRATNFDFDGDGKAEIAVFKPFPNDWIQIQSGNSQVSLQHFGFSGDIVAPADFDGDGKTDLGIFRPSTGDWWYKSSGDGQEKAVHFGTNGDIPRPSDFDGDGKADFIVFRPSENKWYRLGSRGQISNVSFGLTGDKPVTGDFDGDGKSDVAIYRPSSGDWWYQSSINNTQRATHWGISTDIPVAADYDGDGITDFAVYRPASGVWYILNSSTQQATIVQFGISEDKPVAADYDGDGRADIAVYRPSQGTWYLLKTTEGFAALQFGISSDIPIPNAFIP